MADRFVIHRAELAQLLESPDGPVGRELLRRAVKVERVAKQLCAVDTGRLRSSISYEVAVDIQGLAARIGTNVTYAPYIEFGTSRMSPQPFLVPALGAAR